MILFFYCSLSLPVASMTIRDRRSRYPNPAFAVRCAPRNSAPIPRSKGCWFENEPGPRVTLDRERDVLDKPYWPPAMKHIHVPSHWAVHHEATSKQPQGSSIFDQTSQCHAGRDIFSTLPTEILTDILTLLLPSQRTFHFTPRGQVSRRRTSVHQICRHGMPPKIVGRLSLALVCRRLQSVVHDIFYGTVGQNRFVLEMSNVSLTSSITYVHGQKTPQSWGRVRCAQSPDSDEFLCPFSPRTIRHVACLTLCISLSSMPAPRPKKQSKYARSAEFSPLAQALEAFAACFDEKGHSLKQFCLSLDLARREGSRYYSQILRFATDEEIESTTITVFKRAQISMQDPSFNDIIRYSRLCDRSRTPIEKANMATNAKLNEIMAPLLKMRGVQEVKTGGILSDAFAEVFERNAVRPFATTDDETACEPPGKRSRRV